MSFFEILAGMVAIGLVAACIGFFKDKLPEAWRYTHATTDSNAARILKTPSPNLPKIPGKP